jgi:hypothetical protein
LGAGIAASAAVNFVAAWALFGSFICITASLAGVVAYEHWLRNTGKSIPVNPDLMKVFRAVFCRKPSQGRVSHYFLCYHGPSAWGWLILTALIYLICVLTFKAVRESYRQRIEGAGLCPESL